MDRTKKSHIRKTRLKTQQRKTKVQFRTFKVWRIVGKKHGTHNYVKRKVSLAVIKKFPTMPQTQDWNMYKKQMQYPNDNWYIGKTLQNVCEYLKDLFCITDIVHLELRPMKNNERGFCQHITHAYRYQTKDAARKINIGVKGGVLSSTLIHEFLHAAEYGHQWCINGYSDFRSNGAMDSYSPLISKDIFGRKEVIIDN